VYPYSNDAVYPIELLSIILAQHIITAYYIFLYFVLNYLFLLAVFMAKDCVGWLIHKPIVKAGLVSGSECHQMKCIPVLVLERGSSRKLLFPNIDYQLLTAKMGAQNFSFALQPKIQPQNSDLQPQVLYFWNEIFRQCRLRRQLVVINLPTLQSQDL